MALARSSCCWLSRPALVKLDAAVVVGLGLHRAGPRLVEVGSGRDDVRLRVFQVGGRLQQGALEQRGIDQGDDVALVHPRVEVDIELRDAVPETCEPTCTVMTALMVPVASTTS